MTRLNRQWRLARRPTGDIGPADLELVEAPVPALAAGEVLVRNVYLSLDPTNRIWMSDMDQYLPPVEIGAVMRGGTLGVVEESKDPEIPVGAVVLTGLAGWQDYEICAPGVARVVPQLPGLPLTAYMSVLGATGLTAYFGLLDIGQPKPGETVVVSAAAGAVGSIVGQIAKIKGARVVGIVGSAAKADWITRDLGFDAAINYKTEDVGAALDRHCPNGIDVNFENVGGAIMDAVMARMNNFSRMALCGMISTYNAEGPVPGPTNFTSILMHRIKVQGFIVIDYLPRAAEAMSDLIPWVATGQLKYKVHVEKGLETAPQAVKRLFTGDHDGKLLVEVSAPPGAAA
ncbi:MAG: NADP-dependent oxidoreductase [Alphaproteobacteria bacterium]|nr:NADP-dependent oxidoreductase [Alphaproteobacteria bacterium]